MNCSQLRFVGYGLLAIGVINLLAQGSFSVALLRTPPGRLEIANGLITFAPWLLLCLALIFLQGSKKRQPLEQLPLLLLHRLLLPLTLGYVLLIPLMTRDALGYNASLQARIQGELRAYRTNSHALSDAVRPLRTTLAVAQLLQRYPSIAIAIDPADSPDAVKQKLNTALANGEARLQTRMDDLRRNRLEGLFQRTMASIGVAMVAGACLAGLRRLNLDAMAASGYKSMAPFWRADLVPGDPWRWRQNGRRSRPAATHAVIARGWLEEAEGAEEPLNSLPPG